ncbi:MAG: 1-acyl-sn-glycerol-3-phosphate acyltransferase [Anaerolineales bacterium]|nr:1-acyl-sn-glycerol-3-phosphate acyltransferase [Anaerolineales bacterium]
MIESHTNPLQPLPNMVRNIILFLVHLFFKLTARITITGDTAHKDGNYVVVANHLGFIDIALLYHFAQRPDMIVIVADKHTRSPLKRWIGDQVGLRWINRENPDVRLLKQVYTDLKKGGLLVIAPEGTRSPTQALIPGKPGAAYLAARAGVPILPTAMHGTEDKVVSNRLKHFQKLDLFVHIGTPFTLPPLPKQNRDAALQAHTDEIMCQIAALLPASYRGHYAQYPRTLALLNKEPKP